MSDEEAPTAPEQNGLDVYLSHDEACRLHAILGKTACGDLPDVWKKLDEYVEPVSGSDAYDADLTQGFIKVWSNEHSRTPILRILRNRDIKR